MRYSQTKQIVLAALSILLFARSGSAAGEGTWLQVEIGIIGTASEDILESALEEVQKNGYQGLLIKLDTPGGALENTRKMVKAMMAAPIPVIVWVGPSGSRAGSAGAFITIAAHIAAMAPGTNIGAAHPIQASGQDVENKEAERKVMNDTLAFIESIAETRGRNVEMARSFVATSVSVTAEEALENKVIDLVVKDVESLMKKVDGRTVELQSGTKITLATGSAQLVTFERSFRQKLLEILSNPNLFYLLFLAGMIGIGYELTHPGVLFPGVIGGICMILAMIAMSVLPVSYGAAALIIVGIGLLVAEAFVPSFGILGVGGFVAFVLGSIFLVDPNNEQGLRISWYAIAPGAIVVGVAFLTLGYLVVRSERAPIMSGAQGMIGEAGTVLSDFADGTGQVRISGAIWTAKIQSSESVDIPKKGDTVVVTGIKDLVITVARQV